MGNGCTGDSSRNLTLAIVGLHNSGKKAITKVLQGASLNKTRIIIDGLSTTKFKFGGHNILLYNLGCYDDYQPFWDVYFREVYGVIFVIDASDEDSIHECRTEIQCIIGHSKVAKKPVLVLANKQDLPGALDELDLVEKLRIKEITKLYQSPCLVEPCSATSGRWKSTIQGGMRWVLSSIQENYVRMKVRVEADVQELKELDDEDCEDENLQEQL